MEYTHSLRLLKSREWKYSDFQHKYCLHIQPYMLCIVGAQIKAKPSFTPMPTLKLQLFEFTYSNDQTKLPQPVKSTSTLLTSTPLSRMGGPPLNDHRCLNHRLFTHTNYKMFSWILKSCSPKSTTLLAISHKLSLNAWPTLSKTKEILDKRKREKN